MADTAKPTTVQVEPAGAVGAAAAADDDAALLAELEAETGGKPAKPAKAKAPAKAKPAVVAEDEPGADEPAAEPADDAESDDTAAAEDDDPEDEDDSDEDVEPDDEDSDDEDGDPEDELDGEAAKDPELAKRHAALRRTEERQRQRLEQERTAFDRERTAWQAETKQTREAVDRIKGLVARAKIDPAAVLEAFGLSPEDMEYAGQQCYARGKSAAGKPEYRAAAERAARERELAESAATNAKRIADLEAKLEGRETQAAEERELDAYFARAFRKATDATPITARLIAKRPKAARAELAVTANRLAAKLGRLPKVAELLAAHEKREVRALTIRGIKPPTPGTGKPAAAAAATATGKPAAAKPAKRAAAAEPEADDTAIPSTADLVRELQASN